MSDSYEVTIKGAPGGHAWDSAFRNFRNVTSLPVIRPPDEPPALNTPEAYVRWGQQASFNNNLFRRRARSLGVGDDPKPTRIVYVEEGRKWENIQLVNPEDEEQVIPARRITEIAFRAPPRVVKDTRKGYEYNEVVKIDQLRITFANEFEDRGESWLVNSSGDRFEPLVLDPFTVVNEVHWGGDFVVIAVMVTPYTDAQFSVEVTNPPNTEIYTPGNDYGPLPTDNPLTVDVDESSTEGLLPFMEQSAGGNVIDQDAGKIMAQGLTARGMEPLQRFGPPAGMPTAGLQRPPDGVGFPWRPTDNIMRFNIFHTAEGYTHWYSAAELPEGRCVGVPKGTWQRDADIAPENVGKTGCMKEHRMVFSEYTPGGSAVDHIFSYLEDGEEYPSDPNDPTSYKIQWRLDRGVENWVPFTSNLVNQKTSDGFISTNNGDYSAKSYAFFRRWMGTPEIPFDPGPFVYQVFFVDVALLKKALMPMLQGDLQGIQISVKCTHASNGQAVSDEMKARSDSPQGKIRWSWHRSSAREKFGDFMSDLPEWDEEHPPSKDEVWNALHFTEGLVDEEEASFPSGPLIEGDLVGHKDYTVHYNHKSLEEVRS